MFPTQLLTHFQELKQFSFEEAFQKVLCKRSDDNDYKHNSYQLLLMTIIIINNNVVFRMLDYWFFFVKKLFSVKSKRQIFSIGAFFLPTVEQLIIVLIIRINYSFNVQTAVLFWRVGQGIGFFLLHPISIWELATRLTIHFAYSFHYKRWKLYGKFRITNSKQDECISF